MLASIHPLGERARNHRWGVTTAWYLAGSIAGGAALGALLVGTVGRGLRLFDVHTSPELVATICLVAAVVDASGRRLPSPRRQVSEDWLGRYRGWVYGAGFGVQLGMGLSTIVTTASVYAAFALAALSGSLSRGATIGAAFGLTRAIPVLALGKVKGPVALRRFHTRLAESTGWASRLTVAALVGAAIGGMR